MLEEIINTLENNIGTDDFEFIMEDNIMKLEMQNVGIESVTPLLQLMERHPMADFGMPGEIVHFVERFYKNGYEELLVQSIKRRPSMHTVWMLNRIINGSDNKSYYLEIMQDILNRSDIEEEIKEQARGFLNK